LRCAFTRFEPQVRPTLSSHASIAIVLAAAQLACASQAFAQPVAAQDAAQPMPDTPLAASMDDEARQQFQRGRAHYDAGRFGEAAEDFSEAYRLSGRSQLLYNVYVAHRDAGHTEAAVEALRSYLAKVQDAPDQTNLRARLAALEAQLAARAEEKRAKEAEVAAANARAEKSVSRTEHVVSKVPWYFIGAGAGLVSAGAVTGGLALGKGSLLEGDCSGTTCRSSSDGDIHTLRVLSVSTDVLIGTGAAFGITGLALLLTHALDTERELPALGATVTPRLVGATLTTRF
jgi:tetratricopeptide (TPR) repeat protein